MAIDFSKENLISKGQIEEIIREVVQIFLIPHFMSLGLDATGTWRESLEPRGNVLWGAHYTEQLVYGRQPNQDQSHEAKARWAYGMAYHNPRFKEWLRVRGVEEHGMAIAYTIADEGTQIYKQGGTDLLEVLESPAVVEHFRNKLGLFIRTKVRAEFTKTILETFKAK